MGFSDIDLLMLFPVHRGITLTSLKMLSHCSMPSLVVATILTGEDDFNIATPSHLS